MNTELSARTRELIERSILWDSHACMPLRPADSTYFDKLERHRAGGVTLVSVNVYYDIHPPHLAFQMLAALRYWLRAREDRYTLVSSVDDITRAKREGKLAVVFDIEGGNALERQPGLVEVFYRLGVRWMLLAYNKNNRLGGGCQDEDSGLTEYGRLIIDEMERVGMVLCCSHTGYRTAREALEYARRPVIFSHSNPRALKAHDRNIPDDLMRACARTGGVVNLNGIGIFLGEDDASTETLVRHIDYAVNLIGPEHVGLGLDFVFDQETLARTIRSRPDIFPPEKGYGGMAMVEPERFPLIAAALLGRGYREDHVQGILGHNNLRVARQVWR